VEEHLTVVVVPGATVCSACNRRQSAEGAATTTAGAVISDKLVENIEYFKQLISNS